MPRHKDFAWNFPEPNTTDGSRRHSWDSIHAAILMDIRDELKELNKTMGCYRVRQMTDDVARIDRRLKAHMKLPKGRAKR